MIVGLRVITWINRWCSFWHRRRNRKYSLILNLPPRQKVK